MRRLAVALCSCWLLLPTPQAAAQQPHVESLATLFEDVYGPNGLVLSSDDVQLDGTNHAAHFNSAFQSDFRLVNIALTSQLTAVPLPSPASGFTYKFDSATGTFVRSTRSFGPILSDRAETIGRGRLAFGFSHQFFSFDHLDGVRLTAVPAVFRHDAFEAGGGRTDVVSTMNTIESTVSQFTGALTYGITDRVDVSLAVPVVRTRLSLLSNATIYRLGTGTNVQSTTFGIRSAIGGYGSIASVLHRRVGERRRRSARAREDDDDARGAARVCRRRRCSAADRRRAEPARRWCTRRAAVCGVLGVLSVRSRPTPTSPISGTDGACWLATFATTSRATLPDQFLYAVGSDLSVNNRFSIVFDVLGQRVLDSPRLSTYTLAATGAAGSADLPDIRFANGSYWTTDGALGFKANVAAQVLVDFNLRFNIGENGLSDRIAPLIGVEWAF